MHQKSEDFRACHEGATESKPKAEAAADTALADPLNLAGLLNLHEA